MSNPGKITCSGTGDLSEQLWLRHRQTGQSQVPVLWSWSAMTPPLQSWGPPWRSVFSSLSPAPGDTSKESLRVWNRYSTWNVWGSTHPRWVFMGHAMRGWWRQPCLHPSLARWWMSLRILTFFFFSIFLPPSFLPFPLLSSLLLFFPPSSLLYSSGAIKCNEEQSSHRHPERLKV